jgi:hypothetical protein
MRGLHASVHTRTPVYKHTPILFIPRLAIQFIIIGVDNNQVADYGTMST